MEGKKDRCASCTENPKSTLLANAAPGLQDITPEYWDEFENLHGTAFPNTYLSSESILQKLDEYHRLFIFTEEGRFVGYVYVEETPISRKEILNTSRYPNNSGAKAMAAPA